MNNSDRCHILISADAALSRFFSAPLQRHYLLEAPTRRQNVSWTRRPQPIPSGLTYRHTASKFRKYPLYLHHLLPFSTIFGIERFPSSLDSYPSWRRFRRRSFFVAAAPTEKSDTCDVGARRQRSGSVLLRSRESI